MSIIISCPCCGKQLHAPDEAAGRSTKCPHCRTPVNLPPAAVPAWTAPDGASSFRLPNSEPLAEKELRLPPAPIAPERWYHSPAQFICVIGAAAVVCAVAWSTVEWIRDELRLARLRGQVNTELHRFEKAVENLKVP